VIVREARPEHETGLAALVGASPDGGTVAFRLTADFVMDDVLGVRGSRA
jgi:hypothetical protein